MKKDIGNKSSKWLVLTFLILFGTVIISCSKPYDYFDEIIVIKNFMRYHEDPELLNVVTLDKYNITDQEVYYYVEWSYPHENDDGAYDLLLTYNTATQIVKLVSFYDLEHGLFANVSLKWEEVKGTPDKSFSEDEIAYIKDTAIDLINSVKES